MLGARLSVSSVLIPIIRGCGLLGWSSESLNYISQLTVSNSIKEITCSQGSWSMQIPDTYNDPEGFWVDMFSTFVYDE